MKKENKNFIYNALYQIFVFLIPLISIPYVSRKLGVENIGIYSYTYSIVYYFMLGTLLGINNYGTREISKIGEDKEKRSIKFSEIYYLQATLGIFMIIIYNTLIFSVLKSDYRIIFSVHNIFLLSAILDINWLYFGLEEFKLTISRNIIIKLLSLVLILIFVNKPSDLIIYTIIMSGSTLLSQLYLWLFRKKYVTFKKVELKGIYVTLKNCLVLFIPVIAYSIYRVMDKTMLGSIRGTYELGLYENAEKVINIPISLITALGTVMLPSMSKEDNNEIFFDKLYSSFKLCFFMIIPIAFGLLTISDNFAIVFFGKDFETSGIIIKLLIPSFVFSSIANVIRTNYLIPRKKDNVYVISTMIGAVFNFIINAVLIPKIGFYGACIGTVFAEFFVMLYQIIDIRKILNFKIILKSFLYFLCPCLIIFVLVNILEVLISNMYIKLFVQIVIFIISYFIITRKYILYEFFGKARKNVNE